MTTQMVIRMDDELKNQSSQLAKKEGKTLSELVRELLSRYAKEHDTEAHIDGIWERMGDKLADNGVTASDIDAAIAQVRARHD